MIVIRQFTGSLDFSPGSLEKPKFEMTVDVRSLHPAESTKSRDRQLIQETMLNLLEVSRYPLVRYTASDAVMTTLSDSRFCAQFKGELSLHGVTRPQEVDTQIIVLDGEVRLSGAFQLLQSAFGIKPPTAAGGLIAAKDELKFKFDVIAALLREGAPT